MHNGRMSASGAEGHDGDDGDDAAVARLDTPVGRLGVAVTRIGLAAVGWFDPDRLAARLALSVVDDAERTGPVLAQLMSYFRGERSQFDLPLDWRHLSGSRLAVLQTLHATVPAGETISYGELAARSATGVPARAIGRIMRSNPIPVVVPCHRVVARDGLGGYSGGSGRDGPAVKRWLLTLEGALPPTLDRVAP